MCIGHLNRLLINRTYTLNSIQLLRVRHALIDIVNKLENNIDWSKITSWYFSVFIGNSMICSDTVFGINTASDIGIRISRAVGQVKFETILKYHWVVFFMPNITHKLCYYYAYYYTTARQSDDDDRNDSHSVPSRAMDWTTICPCITIYALYCCFVGPVT